MSTDRVYPLHMLDDTNALRPIVVAWILRFDDVLNPTVLQESLKALLEIGDWRKLGGRLRMNNNKRLEVHSPNSFTSERPAFTFSVQDHTVPIDDHHVAKHLPKPTAVPSLQADPGMFRCFAACDSAPKSLAEFLQGDVPMLSLHITRFEDATLVALSWPHVLMDVMGQRHLVSAWSLVLANRENEVPPLLATQDDPLWHAEPTPAAEPERFKLEDRLLQGFRIVLFGLRMGWDMLWSRSIETKTIYLPSLAFDLIRKKAQSDLAQESTASEPPFISDGDALVAWVTQVVMSSLPRPRPLTLLHAMNVRFRLSSIKTAPGVYVQNMTLPCFTLLTSDDHHDSLGTLAWKNRQSVAQQSSEGQILALLRHLRSQAEKGQDASILCGESDALLMPFTDWTRADFHAVVDFGPAVVARGKGEDTSSATGSSNRPGKLVHHQALSLQKSSQIQNVTVIYGNDAEGGRWLTGTFGPEVWEKLQAALLELTPQQQQ